MKSKLDNLCAICGLEYATTRDHIPPNGIFLKPRPQLITVPSCQRCNNDASINDEAFKVFLGMSVVGRKHFDGDSKESRELFMRMVMPTVDHNNALRRGILAGRIPVIVQNNSTSQYETAYMVKGDRKAHDAIIERTIRGLYYLRY